MNLNQTAALSCKLTTPELQRRKKTVILNLKQHLLEKLELANGYSYRFAGSDLMIDLVIDFVKTERLCCDFFHFNMAISNDDALWLTITGPEGAKNFIDTELEL
ncbi:hypothetical protein [Adhaeribacter radiodurans]|uniref:Uncharacterized protein n=1 Tax=Adhaeribacter radiodurans TaxID=2745197 RepID=A0A7L7L155_9BACT|nr:hypothetical protein [Adhaeribacter radiodurans]QMU26521.1 hypothetical protein HUW48_00160 [Adhaeribacter radiodurans]